jgi:hypothetical protein
MMVELATYRGQTFLVPARISLRAKELGTHIIIDAVYLPTQRIEMSYNLRAD